MEIDVNPNLIRYKLLYNDARLSLKVSDIPYTDTARSPQAVLSRTRYHLHRIAVNVRLQVGHFMESWSDACDFRESADRQESNSTLDNPRQQSSLGRERGNLAQTGHLSFTESFSLPDDGESSALDKHLELQGRASGPGGADGQVPDTWSKPEASSRSTFIQRPLMASAVLVEQQRDVGDNRSPGKRYSARARSVLLQPAVQVSSPRGGWYTGAISNQHVENRSM